MAARCTRSSARSRSSSSSRTPSSPPSRCPRPATTPARLLFYEAAEGGAGVLRRLVDEPDALAPRSPARRSSCCHFDPDTGEDLHGAPSTRPSDCEAACYDCLLTYGNQRDHQLPRPARVIADLLLRLATRHGRGRPPAARPAPSSWRGSTRLATRTWSGAFLDLLDDHGYRLPDDAQTARRAAATPGPTSSTTPTADVAVFVDGPLHDYPDISTSATTQADASGSRTPAGRSSAFRHETRRLARRSSPRYPQRLRRRTADA